MKIPTLEKGVSVKCVAEIFNLDKSNLYKVIHNKRLSSFNLDVKLGALNLHIHNSQISKCNVSPIENKNLQKRKERLALKSVLLEKKYLDLEKIFYEAEETFYIYECLKGSEWEATIEEFELKWRKAYINFRNKYRLFQQTFIKYRLAIDEQNYLDMVLGEE